MITKEYLENLLNQMEETIITGITNIEKELDQIKTIKKGLEKIKSLKLKEEIEKSEEQYIQSLSKIKNHLDMLKVLKEKSKNDRDNETIREVFEILIRNK